MRPSVLVELASLRAAWEANTRERSRLHRRITDAAVKALRQGIAPGEVYRLVPFSDVTMRIYARIAGVPPATPGPKPGTRRPPRR